MTTIKNALAGFFGVAVRGQTYLNILYLLLALPLGTLYFTFLVTGFSVGIPTAFIWVGLLVLLAVFLCWVGLVAFERLLTIWMLREPVGPLFDRDLSQASLGQKLSTALSSVSTWKGLIYLVAKFPFGVFSFSVAVTLLSISLALLAMPFYYQLAPAHLDLLEITINGVQMHSVFLIDTLGEALLASLAGVVVTLISMHLMNGLAWVWAKFSSLMLGGRIPAPAVITQA